MSRPWRIMTNYDRARVKSECDVTYLDLGEADDVTKLMKVIGPLQMTITIGIYTKLWYP